MSTVLLMKSKDNKLYMLTVNTAEKEQQKKRYRGILVILDIC